MSGYPKLVRQRTATTCGQCVLAMLMGVRREIAIRIVGHDGITSDADVQRVCGIYEDFAPGAPGFGVVAIQKHREPEASESTGRCGGETGALIRQAWASGSGRSTNTCESGGPNDRSADLRERDQRLPRAYLCQRKTSPVLCCVARDASEDHTRVLGERSHVQRL